MAATTAGIISLFMRTSRGLSLDFSNSVDASAFRHVAQRSRRGRCADPRTAIADETGDHVGATLVVAPFPVGVMDGLRSAVIAPPLVRERGDHKGRPYSRRAQQRVSPSRIPARPSSPSTRPNRYPPRPLRP